jgi:hypothetical protein
MSPQKAFQSIQGLLGMQPSVLAPSVHRSRSASEDPSSLAHTNGAAVPVGYDVDETVNN